MTPDDSPSPAPRPIGYWIAAADAALTRAIDSAQGTNGIVRLEWQVLDSLRQAGAASLPELMRLFKPLAPLEHITPILDRFGEEGWLQAGADTPRGIQVFRLTPAGEARHAEFLATQAEVRRRAVEGIPEEEYLNAVRVLERLVANLS